MIDTTNQTVATVIGVVIGFGFSTITLVIQSILSKRGRRKAAYVHLDGILARVEARSGTREDRELSEVQLMELEQIISGNADVLDKETLDVWYSKKLELVAGQLYKINNLGSITKQVGQVLNQLREDC
jgi:hypothetical protein